MDKKELAENLAKLSVFNTPKLGLEQYSTPVSVATVLLTAARDDIIGKHVIDCGAGTGILGIGALLLGAKSVMFIEKDASATDLLKKNLSLMNFSEEKYLIIHKDLYLTDITADTIIQNPPFGTKQKYVDREFLDYALTHAKKIFTIHKTSTLAFLRDHIAPFGQILSETELDYVLEATYAHHTKLSEPIEVTLLEIECRE